MLFAEIEKRNNGYNLLSLLMLEKNVHDNYIFSDVIQDMHDYKIPLTDKENILFRNLKYMLTLTICYFDGKLVNLCPVFMR